MLTRPVCYTLQDPMTIYEKHSDGWAMGMNWAHGIAGMFPLHVLDNGLEISIPSANGPPTRRATITVPA